MPNGYSIAGSFWGKILLFTIIVFNSQFVLADVNPSVVAALNRSSPVPQVHPTSRIPDLIEAANTFSGTPQTNALIDLSVTLRKIKAEERQRVLSGISSLLSRNEISVRLATAALLKDWSAEISPAVKKRLIAEMKSISSNGSSSEAASANRILTHFGESSVSPARDTPDEGHTSGIQSPGQAVHAPLSGQAWLELYSDELTALKQKDQATAQKIINLATTGQQRQAQAILETYRGKTPQQKDNINSWIKTFERESRSWPDIHAKSKEKILQEIKAKNLEKALAIFNTVKIQIANSNSWIDTNSTKLERLKIIWEPEVFDIISTSKSLEPKYASAILTALLSIESTRVEHIDFFKAYATALNTVEASTNPEIFELKEPRIGQSISELESRLSQIPPDSLKVAPIQLSKRVADVLQVGLCSILIMFVFESLIATTPGKLCFSLFNSGLQSSLGPSPALCLRFFIKYSWLIIWVLIKAINTANKDGQILVFGQEPLLQETPLGFFLIYCLLNLITVSIKGKFLHDILVGTSVYSSINKSIEEVAIPMGFGQIREKSKATKRQGCGAENDGELLEKPSNGPFELRYDDGTLETEGHLTNGNLDGEIKYYNPDGQLSRTSYYADGKLHGLTTTFNENEKPILYECYVNGNLVVAHTRGTLGFWLSRKTTCLEIEIGRRLTALLLDYNFCLLSAGSARFFGINSPVVFVALLLFPIIPEFISGLSPGKMLLRILNNVTILPIKGPALHARWFAKHYPFWMLLISYLMFKSGSIPAAVTESLRTLLILKVVGSILAGFILFNFFYLRFTGVLFHTLVSNPEIVDLEQDEKTTITDLLGNGYFVENRMIFLRLMALGLDIMLIQFILSFLY